ncbi:putative chloride channel protein [Podospora fimiseda]|uniref:Chloride channel protein n=1 Tax=Podospora fimiseda TaxID=252190 RepID=A0AAN7BWF1_9PEZI|nr:putative chloride channel protein [Podospora fimiseda]
MSSTSALNNRINNDYSNSSSSTSTSQPPRFTPSSSSYNKNTNRNDTDDDDELDLLNDHDPLSSNQQQQLPQSTPDLTSPLSFKRRHKQSSSASNFLSQSSRRLLNAFTGNRASLDNPSNSNPPPPTTRLNYIPDSPRHRLSKDNSTLPHDWLAEGPGRRVGYEDLTAIDWIFEYTKERQRQRTLLSRTASSGLPLLGYLQRFLDASQVWIVLILTGIAVGALTAGIDVTTDWLGDIKYGFCSTVDGGAFYLSKTACCYGYDEMSKCSGWKTWGNAMGVFNGAGVWFVEYAVYLVMAFGFATAAAMLVREYAVYAKHSGIPEIKTVLGGFIIRRFLGVWTLITKSLGLVLAVASGMWLGKEGPLVHVACCCANLFIKLFPNINNNEARKREVLSAAAASGISVTFGSPIGGVLFSLEQLSYYFPDKTMWQSFVCAMTAAVVLQAFDPFRSGKLVMYQVTYSTGWHGFELIPYILLGFLGGIYGGFFIKANMWVARWRNSNSWLPGPVVQVAVVAILTGLLNYPNDYMRAQCSDLVSNLFSECSKLADDQFGLCKTGAATAGTIILLIFAAVLGFFLSAITFGLQIPAGIILPSMAIGALTGRAVGIIMEIWQHNHPGFIAFRSCEQDVPCITPGTYAIIGAAAALAGVTRMTVSIVVIMFELTGALTYVLPIMVAVMISKWVGDAFSRRGIYESWIHFSEYPYLDNSEEMVVPDIPASQIMTRIEDLVVLTATGHTIASLSAVLDAHSYRGFPVVSDPRDAILLGYISRAELAYILHTSTQAPRSLPPETEAFFTHQPLADPRTTLDLRQWMDQTPLTLPSRSRLHLAVSYFQKLGLRYVLFVDRGVLQGLLTKKDVWYVLNGAEETRRTARGGATGAVVGGGGGLAREGGEGESEGLLGVQRDDDEDLEPISPLVDRGSIL